MRTSAHRLWTFVSALAAIGTVLAASALPAGAVEEETHQFDATLSLTGNCSTSKVDEVPDPGLCPMPPGVAGVDHPSKVFQKARGIAVDSYGDRYVASFGTKEDGSEGRIDVFDPSGKFLTEIGAVGPWALAVDTA